MKLFLLAVPLMQSSLHMWTEKKKPIPLHSKVDPTGWTEAVYRPDIRDQWNGLHERPGYKRIRKMRSSP
jgi:hypothetical protein